MGFKARSSGVTPLQRARALEEENQLLRTRVEGLMEVNKSQLDRLIGAELLQTQIRELKAKLAQYESRSDDDSDGSDASVSDGVQGSDESVP